MNRGTWLGPSVEHVTLNLRVKGSNLILGIEIAFLKKLKLFTEIFISHGIQDPATG